MADNHPVFMVSDGTGITAETLANSVLVQFPEVHFHKITIPFINTEAEAEAAVERINQAYEQTGQKPLIFGSVIHENLRSILSASEGVFLDLFQTFVAPIEQTLGKSAAQLVGQGHKVDDLSFYDRRMRAVDFALRNDDGATAKNYNQADVILVGVSRCGKTPTCLFLALQHGVRAANFPITDEDLERFRLPPILEPHKHKCFGLTIDPDRLHQIRQERRPDSTYAALKQCRQEVDQVEQIFKTDRVPWLNTTNYSIEEIAARIIAQSGIQGLGRQ